MRLATENPTWGHRRIQIEGTGSYGAGVTSFLRRCGDRIVEVNRGDRRSRRNNGKSDRLRPRADAQQCGTTSIQLELETLACVRWFNEHRLPSRCGDLPPAEFESASYADHQATPTGAGEQTPEPPPHTQGDSRTR